MIHHLNSLSITEKLYETMQPSGNDLRFAAIESNLAQYTRNYAAWHWHEYVEFAYVVDGAADCCTPRQSLTLQAGEGYFVNASVLHMNRMAEGSDAAIFRILQFDTSLLACAGVIARNYIQPIEKATALECVALSPARDEEMLSDMRAIFGAAEEEAVACELEIVYLIYRLWQRLFLRVEPLLGDAPPVPDSQASRIKTMLAYIHAHYTEDISVPDIAASANISEREAYRTFRQVLGAAPSLYLQQYRVHCASRMLTETGESITNISLACGFSSPNYFSMAFKELMGKSPSAFRKNSRS